MFKVFHPILIILIIPVISFAKLSHPPTFEEIKKCYQSDPCCKDLEEAKEYTAKEVYKLHQAEDYRYEISLAIKSFYDGDIYPLWEATQKYRNIPEAHAVFVINILSDYSNDDQIKEEIANFSSIQAHIDIFKEVDSDNSLPDYLQAYYHFVKNNRLEAIRSIKQAEEKSSFKIYTRKFIKHSIATSEYIQYPRFLAYDIGLGTAITGVRPYIYKKLGDQIKKNMETPDSLRSLEILGKRLEGSSVMMITRMMAFNILLRASLPDSEEAKTYKAKSKELLSLSSLFNDKWEAITEKQIIQFYETMLLTDESEAIRKMNAQPTKEKSEPNHTNSADAKSRAAD